MEKEEIVRKTAPQCVPEAVMACLHLAHFTLVGRHRMLQRVSLEAGQWPTIFRKRRFLGLEWSVCMPVFSLPEEQRFEGLGNSGPNLVNWLASLGHASSYALTPAAASKEMPKSTPFHMVCKDTTGRFQSSSDLAIRCAFKATVNTENMNWLLLFFR